MEIEADFVSDLVGICKSTLQKNGFKIRDQQKEKDGTLKADPVDPSYYVTQYFNAKRRSVPMSARQIIMHAALQCPAAAQVGLVFLLDKVTAGTDIMPHASTRIATADYCDMLLNDWGIHHFHLGTRLESSGFINRTAHVLCAYVTSSSFYCLAVLRHGHGDLPWADQENLIEVIHINWPALIQRFRAPGAVSGSLSPPITESDRIALRNAGVVTATQMADGTIYMPIGGGYAMSRDSFQAVQAAHSYLRAARDSEKHLRENIDQVGMEAAKAGKGLPSRPVFRLEMDSEHFYALEETEGIRVKLYKLPASRWTFSRP